MKGSVDCHIPNDRYRANYEKTFHSANGVKTVSGQRYITCAGCGIRIPVNEFTQESLCLVCKKHLDNHALEDVGLIDDMWQTRKDGQA